jgi:hypothetical protein
MAISGVFMFGCAYPSMGIISSAANSQGFGLVCVFSDAVPHYGGADTGCGTHSPLSLAAEAALPCPAAVAETQPAACRVRA